MRFQGRPKIWAVVLSQQGATFLLAKIADQLFARNAMPSPGVVPIGFVSVSEGETVVIAGNGPQSVPLRAFAESMQAQLKTSPLTIRMVEFDGNARATRAVDLRQPKGPSSS